MTDTPKRGFRTRLSHTGRAGKRVHGFVNPPLQRGSTVLYPTVAERRAMAARRGEAFPCSRRRDRRPLRHHLVELADALHPVHHVLGTIGHVHPFALTPGFGGEGG